MTKTEKITLTISNVQIQKFPSPVGKTVGMAKLILGDCFQLTALRIVDGYNGLFVAYPNDPGYKGEDYRSLMYPITKDLREDIESAILEKWKQM